MTSAYMLERKFANGLGYRALKAYASDETALAGCKRLFRQAQPGESLTLFREGGAIVFTLERSLAVAS